MTADLALTRAQHLVEVKRYDEAALALRPALGDTATAPEAFCLLAQCQLGLDHPRKAENAARKALAAGADGEWPHRLIAISRLQREHPRRALKAAKEAARQEPESDHALFVHAQALIAAGRRKRALSVAQLNVATNPHSSIAFLSLGEALAAFVSRKGEAEAAYRSALQLDPDNAEAVLGLAQILRRTGRREEAGKAYLAAAAIDPTDNRVRQGLARLGLPVLVLGATLGGKIVKFQVVRHVLHEAGSLRMMALVWLLGIALGAAVTTWLRVRANRSLPTHVRDGLRSEYRNAALNWGLVGGIGSIVLGLLGVFGAEPGAQPLGVVLLLIGAALVALHRRFHVGSRTSVRQRMAGWRARFS